MPWFTSKGQIVQVVGAVIGVLGGTKTLFPDVFGATSPPQWVFYLIFLFLSVWAIRAIRKRDIEIAAFKSKPCFLSDPWQDEKISEPQVSWWHLPVTFVDAAKNCTVKATIGNRNLTLLWSVGDGDPPARRHDFLAGERVHVPVAARCERKDCTLWAGPNRPRFPITQESATITDEQAIAHGKPETQLSPGVHRIQFVVSSDGKEAFSQAYDIVVPSQTTSNGHFYLRRA